MKHIGAIQQLPEMAESSLPAGSNEKDFYTQMSKGQRRKRYMQ